MFPSCAVLKEHTRRKPFKTALVLGNGTTSLYHQPVECAEGHGGATRRANFFGVSEFSKEDTG